MRHILVTLMCWIFARSLQAQAVSVRVIDEVTRRPVEGAIVGVVDDSGRRLGQKLSDPRGIAVLRAPQEGRFRVRADRIGYPGAWGEWMAPDSTRQSATITVVLPSNPVVLPELTASSAGACKGPPQSAGLSLVLEELRKNVRSALLTAESEVGLVRVHRYTREVALNGRELTAPVDRPGDAAAVPFVAQQARYLHEQGYADSVDGTWRFHAPDAEVLLSDEFLDDHCWRALRYRDGGLALEFEPVPDRAKADIRGSVLLDSATKELTSVDFVYQNLPYHLRAPGLGGRIWFSRIGAGAIRVNRWLVRTPIFLRVEHYAERPTDSLVGYQEEGGVAALDAAATATVVLGDPAPRLGTGSVLIEVEGRVVTQQGIGIPYAELVLGDSVVARANATGGFTVIAAPGTAALMVRAIGFLSRRATISMRLPPEPTTLALQSVAQILDPLTTQAARPVRADERMAAIRRRMQFGTGRLIGREALADPARPTVADLLRGLQGVRLVPIAGGGLAAATARGGGGARACFLSVYRDGTEIYRPSDGGGAQDAPFDLRQALSQDNDAVEIYIGPAQVPAEFSATGSICGLILLWSRGAH